MSDSSEDGSEVQLSLSARKHRSSARSRISSDSDCEERKEVKEQSESSLAVEIKEKDDCDDNEQGNSQFNMQTPRTSERLRRKRTRSVTFPSREKLLESVSSGGKMSSSQTKINSLRPRKLVNNYLKEHTTYVNRDEIVDSDDSGMSDFINDEESSNDSESMSENDNSEAANKDYERSDTNSPGKESIEVSYLEENDNGKHSSDSSLSSRRNKSTSSDEGMKKRVKRRKIKKVIQCSDSDEGMYKTINKKQENKSFGLVENNGVNDSEGSDSSENSELKEENTPLRPRSRRLKNIIQQRKHKHHEMFDTLLKKRQAAKLDPKERLACKQVAGDKNSDRTSSSSEIESDAIKEAEAIFLCTSELDDDDRDFIDDDEQSCDDGLNSDVVSEFLKLLDTFTVNPKNGGGSSVSKTSQVTGHSRYKRRRQWRRRKTERKVSQWRRIKMEAESEDSEDGNDDTEIGRRHPPLHVAVIENDFESVKELIKKDSDCVYELGYQKRTALHLAALEGRVDLVKLLLNHGADRTALDCYHLPAIAYAADGHLDCLRLLLDHANIKSICKRMRHNPQGMNLLHFAIGENREVLECENKAKCLELLFSQDKIACSKLLEERDARAFSPLVAAIYAGQHKCVAVLLKMGANAFEFKTDDGGNMLHFAVECASHFKDSQEFVNDTSLSLREVLKALNRLIDDADNHGFTPLMYACESGNPECVKTLLENGASVNFADSHGTSSLHLAAMSGDTECIQLLLNFGHKVDIIDRYGWPPLLYANFKAHESCVLALMKPKPEQVFILGDLLRKARNELEKKRTVKVVKNVLVSLANHDAYYTVFNDFIRQNPEMLDENNYGLLQHTWRAILDFDNKHRWFRRKLSEIRVMSSSRSCDSIHLEIDRENVLGSAMNQMGRILGHALRSRSLSVIFKNEPGICTGPKREFFACFCKDVIDPKRRLFIAADDSQYSPIPNGYFAKYANLESPADSEANSGHQRHVAAKVKHEQASNGLTEETTELPSATQDAGGYLNSPVMSIELTDEELTTESQAEDHSSILGTDDNGRSITESESTDANEDLLHSESVNGDTEQTSMSRMSLERECTVLNQHIRTCNGGNRQDVSETSNAVTWISCMDDSKGDKSIVSLSLRSKLKQLRFIGRMIGFAVYQNLLLNLQLSKPFVKQILGIPLSHPDDLSSFDYELHKNAVVWVRENSVNELELPFSVDAINPWNSKLVTIELSNDVDRKLTDNNKEEYVKLVSHLKLQTLVKDEVAEFASGLNEVIPRELLSLFTADEFSLLIGGVAKIDVSDWKSNTKYDGWSSTDDEITWFWVVVSQLKEEEKALLMKFSTGSPCVPIGGFASLTGLDGATRFTVLKIEGVNKIPMASTCFNMLKLSRYSSEKHLKDKLLIAIRHGAEGFSFS